MSDLGPSGPQELAGDTSRMILPSGFLFLRGFPNLACVSYFGPGAVGSWSVPHGRGVVAADAHVAATVACGPDFITLDLMVV